jgi:hypothetical protein
MAYRGGAIGYLRSGRRGSAGGDEAQGALERGTGSVIASFAGRKEGRDRDRSSEGEAVVCRLLLHSMQRSAIHHSEFLSRPTTSCGSILSMGAAKCRIAPAR